MIFDFMLFCSGIAMKTGITVASRKDSDFRQRLKERDFLIKIGLQKRGKGRYYKLTEGKLSTGSKANGTPADMTIMWSDGTIALKSMLKLRPKDLVESMSNEIAAGRLTIEMNALTSVWFLTTMKQMTDVFTGIGKKQ